MGKSDAPAGRTMRFFGLIVMAAGLLWGAALLGMQVIGYLSTGTWEPLGLLWYVGGLIGWDWAQDPKSWIGLHSLLDKINAGFGVVTIGVLCGSMISANDKG